jgi:polar amino acid transport system substrate-binding protein
VSRFRMLFLLACLLMLAGISSSQVLAQTPTPGRKIRVAIKPFEPLVFIDKDGTPSGFSIDLWNEIAADIGLDYEWVHATTVGEQIESLQKGEVEAAMAGISMTPEREKIVDFSYPYFNSGLKIMIPASSFKFSLDHFLQSLLSSTLFKLLGLGFLFVMLASHLIWLMERGQRDIPRNYITGVWESLWWSLQMLLKQDYLDQAKPNSVLKRVIVMGWMIFGIIAIAEFTAVITTAQTVSQLQPEIAGPADLPGHRVITVAGSSAENYLINEEIRYQTVDQIDDAYAALENGQADAIVFDAPVLLYYAQHEGKGFVRVVGPLFQEDSYGVAMPNGSPLRKQIDEALLRIKLSGRYNELYQEWFGASK